MALARLAQGNPAARAQFLEYHRALLERGVAALFAERHMYPAVDPEAMFGHLCRLGTYLVRRWRAPCGGRGP